VISARKAVVRPADPVVLRQFCEERLLAAVSGPVLLDIREMTNRELFEPSFVAVCIAPLRIERGLIGALLLGSEDAEPFSPGELSVVVAIARVVALAVEHIDLYNQTQRFASQLEEKVVERTAELRRAHDRLMQAEKFAATGRLAANIAHEINNPLGIIKNYSRLLRESMRRSGHEPGEELEVISEELERIARIVRSLLEFYRPVQRTSPVDLNAEIRALLMLVEPALEQKSIELRLDLAPSLPQAQLAQDHVRQVLLNLLRNAEDAISGAGRITVETLHEPDDGNAGTLVLRVSDTGAGIPPDELPHVFEPFYTTKQTHGTGLGLAVTYAIISSFGGTIDIESSPGNGTTATVRIPLQSGVFANP
jgi:two-component system, NtrC family, sensor kinase